MRQSEEVRAYAEDEDVADVAEIFERSGGDDRLDRTRREEDRALKESDTYDGEDAASPECSREQHDDNGVKHTFGEEDGWIAEQTVIDRSDDSHCTDADRQRGSDEAVDEMRVPCATRHAFQPRAECRHAILDIDEFAEERAADEAGEQHICAGESELPVWSDAEHFAQRPAHAEKDHGNRAGAHDRLLKTSRDEASTPETQYATEHDGDDICNDSDSWHGNSPLAFV